MMAKKKQLDPETNNQVESSGDEPLKIEEPNQKPQDEAQTEEPANETMLHEVVEDDKDLAEEQLPDAKLEETMEVSEEVSAVKLETAESEVSIDSSTTAQQQPIAVDPVEAEEPAVSEVATNGEVELESGGDTETKAPDNKEKKELEVVESSETIDPAAEVCTEKDNILSDGLPQAGVEELNIAIGELDSNEADEFSQEVDEATEVTIEKEHEGETEDNTPSKKDETGKYAIAEEAVGQPETPEESPAEDKVVEETEETADLALNPTEVDSPDKDEDFSEKFAKLDREELVLAIEALVKNEDVSFIRKQIGFIKVAYHKLTRSEKEKLADQSVEVGDELAEVVEAESDQQDPLKIRFDEAFKVYKSKKSEFDQVLDSQKQENLVGKEAILEALRQLIESEEELKKTYDQFRDLQERWRNIGAVPQLAKNNLWNNYHFLIEKFFDKVKINKELKDLDLKKNLELKTELCEKAEELLLETSIVTSFQKLQKLHETWKETGPVPNDKKDEIWERFRAATVKLNQRREGHYKGLSQEQDKNFAAKLVLCEKAEQIAELGADNPRTWQEQTNEINELFKVWKTIGFAPKKVNNEIWNRFRIALNTFFRNKKEYLGRFKDVQTENYNQKLNLCIQAEALKDSTDWSKATNEFISLQNQWKSIGKVPPKFSDKIWKRFRGACDEFFIRKSEFFASIDQTQDKNLNLKKGLIEKIKNHPYTADNTDNLKIINEFQRQWMEIGHVPIKLKDKIHSEFRKAIDEKFESLGITRKAKTALSFRNKLDNIKSNPNADNIIYKERTFLINRISQLQNDINLWENNIGFFASSKKADLLKKEFEDKIENAKQDIAIMEEKLKILREQ